MVCNTESQKQVVEKKFFLTISEIIPTCSDISLNQIQCVIQLLLKNNFINQLMDQNVEGIIAALLNRKVDFMKLDLLETFYMYLKEKTKANKGKDISTSLIIKCLVY
jgi:hypothetical protein